MDGKKRTLKGKEKGTKEGLAIRGFNLTTGRTWAILPRGRNAFSNLTARVRAYRVQRAPGHTKPFQGRCGKGPPRRGDTAFLSSS